MMRRITGTALAACVLMFTACGDKPKPQTLEDRDLVHTRAQAALADFKSVDPTLSGLLESANAYAIFPRIVTAALVVGGGHGEGEVYQKGRLIGTADVSQGSVGAQLGGQKYAELVLFDNESSLVEFQHGTLEFDARASAIAASNGAARTADYSRGVLVFTLPEGGLMAQASLGLQKFRYRALP